MAISAISASRHYMCRVLRSNMHLALGNLNYFLAWDICPMYDPSMRFKYFDLSWDYRLHNERRAPCNFYTFRASDPRDQYNLVVSLVQLGSFYVIEYMRTNERYQPIKPFKRHLACGRLDVQVISRLHRLSRHLGKFIP